MWSEHWLRPQIQPANNDEGGELTPHSPCRAFVTPSMIDILFGAFSSHTKQILSDGTDDLWYMPRCRNTIHILCN